MFAPKTTADLIDLIRMTPHSVLSEQGRARIAAVMSFEDRTVGDLMVPKSEMVFVKETDLLGPLMLDQLYKSGFTNFPVVGSSGKVKGVIHTEDLNALRVKQTGRAEECMDVSVCFLHAYDSLEFAVEEIERTNAYYFLVLDSAENLAGFFTVEKLLRYLLGE